MKTMTKGNVIIEELKIGDTIYEYNTGLHCESIVMNLPVLEGDIYSWYAKEKTTNRIIHYKQNVKYPHYGLNIYTYPAYVKVKRSFKKKITGGNNGMDKKG